MAGKRSASSDLNHDNWDRDDDVEDAGTFQKASDDVLKRRIIKTARRRNPEVTTGNGDDGAKKPVFGGFTGFAGFAPPNPNAAFSFLNNSNTVKTPPSSTITSPPATKPSLSNTSIFSSSLTNGVESKGEKKTNTFAGFSTGSNNKKADTNDHGDDRTEYYAKLKGLNESVLTWIDKHVKENPFINLKPIFTDYERYLTDLEVKHVSVCSETKKELVGFSFKSPSKTNDNNTATTTTTSAAFSNTNKSIFSLSADNKKSEDKVDKPTMFGGDTSLFGNKKTNDNKFPFGAPSSTVTSQTNADKDKATFVFGSANASKTSTITSGAFGSGTNSHFGSKPMSTPAAPFAFGTPANKPPAFASTPAQPTETINLDEDDEDQPPKVEFTPVVEQEHIYTIRCKVFVKKDGNFGDRGVGNLYLKKIPDSEKVQLIVRADTNLGNLLCNLILSESVPTQRMGKKDVMLVCIPLPDEKPPPVPMLLRVKNEQEADALLKELEKHKK